MNTGTYPRPVPNPAPPARSLRLRPLRALLVEDCESDALLVIRELSREFRVEWTRVWTENALLAALEDPGWDIVVSDYSLPELSAPEALAIVLKKRPDVPFIIVSGTIGEDVAVDAMRAGAQDFLTKSNLQRLNRAVDRELIDSANRRARRTTEAALRFAKQALDHAGEAILHTDAKGRIGYGNEAARRLLGCGREHLPRLAMDDIDCELGPGGWAAEWDEILRAQGRTRETSYRALDGRCVPVELTASRLEVDGEPCCVLFARDITQRRTLQAQLLQAQKMEALGRLAGGVAHDFNNLLTVILSYCGELALTADVGGTAREDIEAIRSAGLRAAELTRQLLMFSRHQIQQPRVLKPNSVIADLEKMIRRVVGEDIAFETRLAPDTGLIKVDPGQLGQAILNLVVNARDAMPIGGRLLVETQSVSVDARGPEVRGGRYALISVHDSGTGIAPELKPQIFEPFFTTKEAGKGTGLGLSTVASVARDNGGFVDLESEVGRGSVFKLFFPIALEPEEHTAVRASAVRRGAEKILLVEDEEAVREITKRVLESSGYRVATAANGAEALARMEADRDLQLLLTDVVMPGLSGPELADALRPARPGLKVLYTSGYAPNAAFQRAILPADCVLLEKPFTAEALLGKVREALDR